MGHPPKNRDWLSGEGDAPAERQPRLVRSELSTEHG
jgi:hypothetical protein